MGLKLSILWVSLFGGAVMAEESQVLFEVRAPLDGQEVEEGVPFAVEIASNRTDLNAVTVYMGDQLLLDMPFPYFEGSVVVDTLPADPVLTLIGHADHDQQVVTKRLQRSNPHHTDPVAKDALFQVISPRDGESFFYGDSIIFQGTAVAPCLESIEVFINGEPYTTLMGPEFYDYFLFPYDADKVELKAVARIGEREQVIVRNLQRNRY